MYTAALGSPRAQRPPSLEPKALPTRKLHPMTAAAAPVDLLIFARWLLPIAPAQQVLEHQAIAISDGRITGIYPADEARRALSDDDFDGPDFVRQRADAGRRVADRDMAGAAQALGAQSATEAFDPRLALVALEAPDRGAVDEARRVGAERGLHEQREQQQRLRPARRAAAARVGHQRPAPASYTPLRAHENVLDLV